MNRYNVMLLPILVILGCGTAPITPNHRVQMVAFSYYDLFDKEHYARHADNHSSAYNIAIDFVDEFTAPDVKERVVALCYHQDNHIEVRTRHWDTLSDTQKEIVVFHELGHCLLGRVHNESKQSIMYPSILPAKLYLSDREGYLDRLFGGNE